MKRISNLDKSSQKLLNDNFKVLNVIRNDKDETCIKLFADENITENYYILRAFAENKKIEISVVKLAFYKDDKPVFLKRTINTTVENFENTIKELCN